MKKTMLAVVSAFFAVLAAFGTANASEYTAGIGVKSSTLGLGVELTGNVADSFNVRLQGNGFNYNYNSNQTDLTMSAKLKLMSVGAIADYYPFGGKFRLSAGLYYNNNKIDMVATPLAGTFTIGGTTYTAAQAGTVTSNVTFNKVAPYVGFGWGDAISEGSPFGMSFEVGVLYQGTPKVKFNATGAAVTSADIAAEQADIQNKVSNYKFYPVVAIGFNYAF